MPKTVTKIDAIPVPVKRKKVAAYARVSMESERLQHSLSAQVSYYSELIQSNPEWEYAGVYADSGISGTETEKRSEFNHLIADCENHLVDIILTKSISRFARNTVDLLNTIRHLKELGVEVRFEKEGINSMSGDGELMLSILASFAQEESRSISENVKWGVRKGYEEGKPKVCPLYGYRIINGSLVINEDEAAVVKRIFQMYLDGDSCCAIAKKLNAEGIKSYTGKEFSNRSIILIIRQEKYTGNSLYQKVYLPDHITHKKCKNKGELPMYYMENTHPAIISTETFTAAQKEFSQRYGAEIKNGIVESSPYLHSYSEEHKKVAPHFRKAHWPEELRKAMSEKTKARGDWRQRKAFDLSQFIKCENCGGTLTAYSYTFVNGTTELRWSCRGHNRKAPDTQKPVNLKDEVMKEIICEVLKIDSFSRETMEKQLAHISILGDKLTFHFKDGHKAERIYIKM